MSQCEWESSCIAQVHVTETLRSVRDRDSEMESSIGIEGAWGNVRSRITEGSYVTVVRSNGY